MGNILTNLPTNGSTGNITVAKVHITYQPDIA